jgi:hypothetical protein
VLEDLGAYFEAARVVHLQNLDGCAPDGREPGDLRAVESKVVGPPVASRVEEVRDLAGLSIDPGQIWPLVEVATLTCERQIVGVIGAAVLLRDDVLHMMCQGAMLLSQAAILTPITSPAWNEVPRRRVHSLLNGGFQVQAGL